MSKWFHSGGLLILVIALASQNAAAAETVKGCLEKEAEGFTLNASGKRLSISGDPDFEGHVGHTVELTGEESGKSFRATALKHLSPTCDDSTSSSSPAAPNQPTASDQGNSEADIETTAKIRRAIVDDDNLSTLAQNITIVTRDGKVTLRGEVRSMQEKSAVAAKAQAVVAGAVIDNQITVRAESKKSTQERR